ncbi:methyltransferase domain-containing protein [Crossiella sp. SN42]|uniref:methyltransferase domain-containing protein n=1 Tax=Crossiella sp. SN42 TaxID=2944808 RepID=UPI00207CA1FD|nr:methyltransferase domain-containing protein [Crossiella sp. SN42]MCO1576802.1 methyltransferase domain-containing protein [Crossiella sp. SN42]
MTAARLVARTVRGLEQVVAEEVRPLGPVEFQGHREVWFRAQPTPAVLGLRCADDVLLHGISVRGVGPARADLPVLAEAAARMPLAELLMARKRCGGKDFTGGVDVSASFLGRRNYNRYDLEDAVGRPVASALGLPYWSRRGGVAPPDGGLSWRVTVEGDRALVALRIGERPLHRRGYRRVTRAGSLHPPVAAAMARLGGGGRVLDPCCGAGTLAVEAALGGAEVVLGLDRDAGAVAAARVNGAAAGLGSGGAGIDPGIGSGTGAGIDPGVGGRIGAGLGPGVGGRTGAGVGPGLGSGIGAGIGWGVADAGRLPVADGSIDLVLCNPPWDRQVPPTGVLARRPQHFWRELRRVLRPGGRAVLLLPANALPRAGFQLLDRLPISLSGQHPEIVTVRRD